MGLEDELRTGPVAGDLKLRPTTAEDQRFLEALFAEPSVGEAWGIHDLTPDARAADRVKPVDHDGGAFVVVWGGREAGYLAYDRSITGEAALHFALMRFARGQGVGTRMLRLLGDALLANPDVTRLCVMTDATNEPAVRAVGSAGFEPVPNSFGRFDRSRHRSCAHGS